MDRAREALQLTADGFVNLFGVTFRHGVHPPDSKELTGAIPVRRMPFPERIALPLRQHAGKPARCLVKPGDHVERGDKIAEADGFVSVPIHASAAGTVADVDWWPHPDGSMTETVIIDVEPHSPQIPRPRSVPALGGPHGRSGAPGGAGRPASWASVARRFPRT